MGADYDTPNRQEPARLNTGITVVGKRAVIPAGIRLGRNVKVNEGVRPSDFGGRRSVPSGGTVEAKTERGRRGRRAGSGAKSADGAAMAAARMTASG
jgi:hypothetical protein